MPLTLFWSLMRRIDRQNDCIVQIIVKLRILRLLLSGLMSIIVQFKQDTRVHFDNGILVKSTHFDKIYTLQIN